MVSLGLMQSVGPVLPQRTQGTPRNLCVFVCFVVYILRLSLINTKQWDYQGFETEYNQRSNGCQNEKRDQVWFHHRSSEPHFDQQLAQLKLITVLERLRHIWV